MEKVLHSSSDLVEENTTLREELSHLCQRVASLESENLRLLEAAGTDFAIEDYEKSNDIVSAFALQQNLNQKTGYCTGCANKQLMLETSLKAQLSAVSQKLEIYIVQCEQLELASRQSSKESDKLNDLLSNTRSHNEQLKSRTTELSDQITQFQGEITGILSTNDAKY